MHNNFLELGHTYHCMLLLLYSIVGMKFWKTGKIVKAISESDYQKLQRSRGISTDQPGPSRSLPVIVSDSDSDRLLVPLVRKKRFSMFQHHLGQIQIQVNPCLIVLTPPLRRCLKKSQA